MKTTFSQEGFLPLRGRGVMLRPPMMADYAEWAELRGASRHHLEPWEPLWAGDELSRWAYRRRLRYYQRESRDDHGQAFFIFREADQRLIGGLTFSNMRRGVTQAASIGYWLGEPYVGQGLMSAAVALALDHAFETLRLHRVEAASMLTNVKSLAVLDRAGFSREGVARRYLRINGVWQDHVVFAILADDTRAPTSQGGRS